MSNDFFYFQYSIKINCKNIDSSNSLPWLIITMWWCDHHCRHAPKLGTSKRNHRTICIICVCLVLSKKPIKVYTLILFLWFDRVFLKKRGKHVQIRCKSFRWFRFDVSGFSTCLLWWIIDHTNIQCWPPLSHGVLIDRSRIYCSPSLVTVATSDKLKFVFDIQRGKKPDC